MPDEESLSGVTLTNTTNTKCSSNTADAAFDPAAVLARGDGHYKLAEMMNQLPACAIFRTFGTSNALNILYYQAELCQLENRLVAAAERDRSDSDSFKQDYFKCFDYLQEGKTENGNMDITQNEQWQTVLRIRALLKEYSKSVLVSKTHAPLT